MNFYHKTNNRENYIFEQTWTRFSKAKDRIFSIIEKQKDKRDISELEDLLLFILKKEDCSKDIYELFISLPKDLRISIEEDIYDVLIEASISLNNITLSLDLFEEKGSYN